jgi:glycosyltransferase involved in cell wall biosynthesis
MASNDRHIVSLIIPTIGRKTLYECLIALDGQTRPPDEVIAITDHKRQGRSWACNEGIGRARGDLLAFADDDCAPSRLA